MRTRGAESLSRATHTTYRAAIQHSLHSSQQVLGYITGSTLQAPHRGILLAASMSSKQCRADPLLVSSDQQQLLLQQACAASCMQTSRLIHPACSLHCRTMQAAHKSCAQQVVWLPAKPSLDAFDASNLLPSSQHGTLSWHHHTACLDGCNAPLPLTDKVFRKALNANDCAY
jgi:hypothetical protein